MLLLWWKLYTHSAVALVYSATVHSGGLHTNCIACSWSYRARSYFTKWLTSYNTVNTVDDGFLYTSFQHHTHPSPVYRVTLLAETYKLWLRSLSGINVVCTHMSVTGRALSLWHLSILFTCGADLVCLPEITPIVVLIPKPLWALIRNCLGY